MNLYKQEKLQTQISTQNKTFNLRTNSAGKQEALIDTTDFKLTSRTTNGSHETAAVHLVVDYNEIYKETDRRCRADAKCLLKNKENNYEREWDIRNAVLQIEKLIEREMMAKKHQTAPN